MSATGFVCPAAGRPSDSGLACHAGAVGQPILDASHEQGLLERTPRAAAAALPPELQRLGETAAAYFKILAANGRSLRREIERLVLLSELFGDSPTRAAVEEVMATGHVGAEHVE